MKAAVISLGGRSSLAIGRELHAFFETVDVLDLRHIEVTVGSDGKILYKGTPLGDYDAVIIRGSYKYVSVQTALAMKYEHHCYMPVLPSAFNNIHNKLITHFILERHKIPMPRTYVSSTAAAGKELLKKIMYPIILKIPQGTQGKGVMFAESYAAAISVLDTLMTLNQPFLIQEYIETNGCDIRAIVVGDKVVACMRRIASEGDKRSNLHAGGTYEAVVPTDAIIKISLQTAKALGAEICGIDILEGVKSPLVIEANISPGLEGISKATGIQVPRLIAEYISRKTVERIEAYKGKNDVKTLLKQEGGSKYQKINNVISPIDFRGERMLLPKTVSDVARIREGVECLIEFGDGFFSVKKI